MPAEIYYDDDADLSIIQGRTVAVLGDGSQAHAQALCLRDSGVDVRVGLPEGSANRGRGETEGLRVLSPDAACAEADVIMILAPDHELPALYADSVQPHLQAGDALLFGRGFTIRFGYLTPPRGVDVALVAPTSPGRLVRGQFCDGKGVPCLVAVEQDATGQALALTLSYAKGIGGTRAGVIPTTFTEETDTGLFGADLCGGVDALVRTGFDTLVAAGYRPEIAYLACVHELRLMVDLRYDGGIAGPCGSAAAEYAGHVNGPRLVDERARQTMGQLLAEIRDGTYAARFVADQDAGAPEFASLRAAGAEHPIEATGRKLRSLMSWLPSGGDDDEEGPAALG